MVKRLFIVLQTCSLIAVASAMALAQGGQSSRSNAQSGQMAPSANHHQHLFSQARAVLEVLSFAPDIPVQVAHLASSGPGYNDPPGHSVVEVLADAVSRNDSRTRRLWFDAATNAHPTNSAEVSELLVKLIRRIGVKRILYGSDSALGNNLLPRESWEAFRQLKLSKKEMETIAGNVAPYFR